MSILKAKLIRFGSIWLLLTPFVLAKDLGIVGETFTIAEKDLLEVIMNKLHNMQTSGELETHNRYLQNKVKERVMHPKPYPLPETKKEREFFYDPTITVEEDLTGGKGEIFHHKGEKVNPLDTVKFHGIWVFFDGTSNKQCEFAKSLYKIGQTKLILIAGSPLELMSKWQIPVYFDQFAKLIKKLEIVQVPAVVVQENKRLKITERDISKWTKE